MSLVTRRNAVWIVAGGFALAALVAFALAVAPRYGGADQSLDRVRQAGVLRVGYSVEPPFAVVGPDGAVSGQSVECAVELARALGVRVEWVQTELDRQIPDLLSGRFDVIAAGLFVSPERAQKVQFSVSTLRVRPAWLTRAGSAAPTLQALRNGWRLAVVRGSAAERHLAAQGLSAQLHLVPDVRTGLAGVSSGIYDALALPLPAGRTLVDRRPGDLAVWPADDGRPVHQVALAFRPQDRALSAAADTALAAWLPSPAYRERLARYGLSPEDLPAQPHARVP